MAARSPPASAYKSTVSPKRRSADPLTVTGKRLDGPAPMFTETEESSGFGPDYSMGGIEIPTFGCWQITGRYKDADLTFTVWVASVEKETAGASLPQNQGQPSSAEPAPLRVFVDGDAQAKSLVYRVAQSYRRMPMPRAYAARSCSTQS